MSRYFVLSNATKTQIESESNHLPTSCSSSEDISKYIKTVITMVTLLVILIGSYATFVGVTNALAFGFGRRNRRALSTAYTVLSNWIFFTSSLNPVLYCWRLGEIRKAVMKLIFFLAKSVNTLYTIIGLGRSEAVCPERRAVGNRFGDLILNTVDPPTPGLSCLFRVTLNVFHRFNNHA